MSGTAVRFGRAPISSQLVSESAERAQLRSRTVGAPSSTMPRNTHSCQTKPQQ